MVAMQCTVGVFRSHWRPKLRAHERVCAVWRPFNSIFLYLWMKADLNYTTVRVCTSYESRFLYWRFQADKIRKTFTRRSIDSLLLRSNASSSISKSGEGAHTYVLRVSTVHCPWSYELFMTSSSASASSRSSIAVCVCGYEISFESWMRFMNLIS